MTTLGRFLTLLAVPLALAAPLALGLAGAAVAEPGGLALRGIADAAERLKCYDAESVKAGATDKAGAPAGTGVSGWVLERRRDPLTDGVACVISPPGKPYVRVGRDGHGRRVRPARRRRALPLSASTIPSRAGCAPRRAGTAPRSRCASAARCSTASWWAAASSLEVTTFGAGVVVEEFDLAGLSAQHDRLLRECP